MPIYLFADKQHSGEIEISMTVDCLLRSIGGTRTLVGFRYAEFMIERALQNPDEVQLITKRLYPELLVTMAFLTVLWRKRCEF